MPFLVDNAQYALKLIKAPAEDAENTALFLRAWASRLFTNYSTWSTDPFMLRIGEYHTDRQEYGLIAQLWPHRNEPLNPPFVRLDAAQNYFARQTGGKDASYSGRVEISAAMTRVPGEGDFRDAVSPAEYLLVKLALCAYYKAVADNFLDWSTSYFDAAKISTYLLGSKETEAGEGIWGSTAKAPVQVDIDLSIDGQPTSH